MEFMQLMQHWMPLADYWANVGSVGAIGDFNSIWIGFNIDWVVNQFDHGLNWALLAQEQFDTDVFAATRRAINEFVASGKLWTLLIGIVIGYILKSVTSYG